MTDTDHPRAAALLAATGFFGVACFQVSLALGAPWRRAAWGGAQAVLPQGLRVASALAAVFLIGAALIVLRRGAS